LIHFWYRHKSLLSTSSELGSFVDIIALSNEANYSPQEVIKVLFHAATSSNDSLEPVVNYQESKRPKIRIPLD